MTLVIPKPSELKCGVVVGSFGYPGYIELGLQCLWTYERLNRVINDISTKDTIDYLIHEDNSPAAHEVAEVACKYGADFYCTPKRLNIAVGDMSAVVEGMKWAQRSGMDILVKLSRRFIIDKPFVNDLKAIMSATQMPTACAPDAWTSWGYRSECQAFYVPAWVESGALAEMQAIVDADRVYGALPEAVYHDLARKVNRWMHPGNGRMLEPFNYGDDVDWTVRNEQFFQRASWDGYVPWYSVLGLSKKSQVDGVYWHDSRTYADYAALAQSYGLAYTEKDFEIVDVKWRHNEDGSVEYLQG